MVIKYLLSYIQRITFLSSSGLFLTIFAFLMLSISISFTRSIVIKLKSMAKRSIFDILYKYMLGEITIDDIRYRRAHKDITIEAFSKVISSITGNKQERMMKAVTDLGLINTIEKGLKSFSSSRRMRSCYLLGLLKSTRSTQLLTATLFHANPKVISSAIIALGELKQKKSIPSMMNYFKDAPLPHAWLIAAVLPFFGKEVYEFIASSLKPDSLPTEKLLLLINVIAQFKLPESLDQLRTLYTECDDLDIRLNALRAIGMINDLIAVKTAIDALSAEEWQIRSVACIIIGQMSIKGAAYRLVPLLKDKYWHVRKNAAGALVKLGKLGLNALIAYMEIDDKNAREMIVQTLEENGMVEQAIVNLQREDETIKNESFKLIKALSEKGFNQYLENYRSTMPVIEKLIG